MIDPATFEEIGVLCGYMLAALKKGIEQGLKEHNVSEACREVEEQLDNDETPEPEGKTNIMDCLECKCDECARFETDECVYYMDGCAPCVDCENGKNVHDCDYFKQGGNRNHS